MSVFSKIMDIRRYYTFRTPEPHFWELYNTCKPYTMTSVHRMYALYKAVEYIQRSGIPGSLVECGVWKGGSSMLMAKYLVDTKAELRPIFLYDTFEGMPEPTLVDLDFLGRSASNLLALSDKSIQASIWCYSPFDEVEQNMLSTGYDPNCLSLVKGLVEYTIPDVAPGSIALLRLDTDFYESTKHELTHLWPRLVSGRVLIVDDYGHWQGARKAVDEFFADKCVLFHRIDYSGITIVKH